MNGNASELIEEAKEKAKKVPQGSVQHRICVEELDLIRLFQTGRQTNARSLLYLSTSNVQCRISNDNQTFRQPIPGLKHIEFCPFCEKKDKKVLFEGGLHMACCSSNPTRYAPHNRTIQVLTQRIIKSPTK